MFAPAIASVLDGPPEPGIEIDDELGGTPMTWYHRCKNITIIRPEAGGSQFTGDVYDVSDTKAFEEAWGYTLTGKIVGYVEELQQAQALLAEVIEDLTNNAVLGTLWGTTIKDRASDIEKLQQAIDKFAMPLSASYKGTPRDVNRGIGNEAQWIDTFRRKVAIENTEDGFALKGRYAGIDIDIPMRRTRDFTFYIPDDPEQLGQARATMRNISDRLAHFNNLSETHRKSVLDACETFRERLVSAHSPIEDLQKALIAAMDEATLASRTELDARIAPVEAAYRLPAESHDDLINSTLDL